MNRLATMIGALVCIALVVEIIRPDFWKRIARVRPRRGTRPPGER